MIGRQEVLGSAGGGDVTLPRIHALVDEGLGNSSYLVDLGGGRALAVDPTRDLRALRGTGRELGLSVAFAAETHLHADFLSGALQLVADDGAQALASAAGGREFPHRGLQDGDEVDLGGLTLRALATPGHTPEHLSFLLLDGPAPVAVFTGGSLIVGAAARTDLSGADRTEALARAQYRSLQRLIGEVPDDTLVLPTHGAGSFCSAPPVGERTTTIGAEKAGNELLAAPDESTFVRLLLGGLGSYPAYFDRLGELNRRGAALTPDHPALHPLSPTDVRALEERGAQVVDVRPVPDFAAAHLPGSLSIELRDAFATWLGWLVDPNLPVVIVRNPDQDVDEILWQALKIGYDGLTGELAGGITAWRASGGATASIPVIDAADADPHHVVDIRQHSEFAASHLPGARNVELADVTSRPLAGPVQTLCGHGERAATAAGLLVAAGRTDVTIVVGGPAEWSAATGNPLQSGT
ncbi:MAG TPA: MBL fold metallo-hydrolase [Mycobacteriales bacterium]|nr:MBL fold metallo-hydrolase [Mycobacteriales bacterium]